MVKLLIDHGALITQTDQKGNSPLHWASLIGALRCVEILLQNQAQPQVCVSLVVSIFINILTWYCLCLKATNHKGCMPLHMAAWGGKVECLAALLNGGAAIDAQCDEGWTALHYAAYSGHFVCMSYLLEHGASLSIVDIHRRTALHKVLYLFCQLALK